MKKLSADNPRERAARFARVPEIEVKPFAARPAPQGAPRDPWWNAIKFLLAGMYFGILLVKSEIVSWVRIQEMFLFQSFRMYGLMLTAVATGVISHYLLRKFGIRSIAGLPIRPATKKFNLGQVYGGFLFGIGWALAGACPGSLYALVGTGATIFIMTLLFALAGTWVYGAIRKKLPH